MKHGSLFRFIVSFFLLIPTLITHASQDSLQKQGFFAADSINKQHRGAVVAPFGTPIFSIHARLGPFTPEERAEAIDRKVKKIEKDPFFHSDSVKIFKGEITTDVMYGESVITSVCEADAIAEGSTREDIARSRQTKIIYAIERERRDTNPAEILKNVAISIGILVLLIILITLLNKAFRLLSKKMILWQDKIMNGLHLKEFDFFNRERQLKILLILVKILRWIVILLLVVIMLLAIFYLLPWTKAISISILGFVINPLKNIMVSFWEYLPNLITIIVILIVTRLIIRFFKFLKSEVEKETLKVPGFYPDWALPTFNILRVLIIIFTIVAIWPYLPGSGSQVFQGVSVFFGLVFSLTSASALSNFMAGLTITYTRAFKMGDRVKIGEVTGNIIEKSMLVTKIRTIKNEEITIPNNKIMNSEVINFSTLAPDMGLIMHTTVTQ